MATAPNAVNSQFDYQRKKAAQQEAANQQVQKDAIQRRLAAQGGGPGGVAIKMDRQVADESARRLADVNEGINEAENAEMRRIKEIEDARKFQTSEREASQLFARGEREASQGFAKGEREASQGFAKGEREASQVFASGQSALDRELQKYGIDINKALQEGQLTGTYGGQQTLAAKTAADQASMAKKEFDENVKTNYINAVISAHNSKIPPEQMGQLLSQLGINFNSNGEIILAPVPGLTSAAPTTLTPLQQQLESRKSQTAAPKYGDVQKDSNGRNIYFNGTNWQSTPIR